MNINVKSILTVISAIDFSRVFISTSVNGVSFNGTFSISSNNNLLLFNVLSSSFNLVGLSKCSRVLSQTGFIAIFSLFE